MEALVRTRGLVQGAVELLRGDGLRDRRIHTARPGAGLALTTVLRATGQVEERVTVDRHQDGLPVDIVENHRAKVKQAVAARQGALGALLAAPGAAVALLIAGWLGAELLLSEAEAAATAAQALWRAGLEDPLLWKHLGTVAWGWLRPVVDGMVVAWAARGLRSVVAGLVRRWVRRRLAGS